MPAKFVTCQLCGQGFGSASIGIHVPQCYDKALKRWQLDQRGPKPVMPNRHSPAPMKSEIEGIMSIHGGGTIRSQGAALHQQQQPLYSEVPSNVNLHPCKKCGRKFAFDRIAYHESVCAEGGNRKKFNSKKQRLSEFDQYELKAAAKSQPVTAKGKMALMTRQPAANRTSWRQQHTEFIAAIRSARQYQKAAAGPQQVASKNAPRGIRQPRQPFASSALRNPDMYKQSRAPGLGAAPRGSQLPQLPVTQPVTGARGANRGQVASTSSGSSRTVAGAPSYRILNTNQTSRAMLEALGRF